METYRNKSNVILIIILLFLVLLGTILGIKFFSKPTPKAIDFSNMSESEIVAWSKNEGIDDLVEFKYEYDEDIEEGKVIYQSVKIDDEISDNMLIIISKGKDPTDIIKIPVEQIVTKESFDLWVKDKGFNNIKYEAVKDLQKDEGTIISVEPKDARIEDQINVKYVSNKDIDVPDFTYMSKDEITNWSNDNGVKISFNEETSDLDKGSFISQSLKPGEKVNKGETIIIKVSKGKDENKKPDNETETNKDTAYIDPNKYLGVKEEDFLKALKDLGYTNVVKIDEVTSSRPAGTICYYLPDGNQKLDTKISYKVSKDTTKENKTAYIDPNKYLGTKEEDFLKTLKDLGYTNVVKIDEVKSNYPSGTICYYLPDGNQKLDTKISYKISKPETVQEPQNPQTPVEPPQPVEPEQPITNSNLLSVGIYRVNNLSNSYETTKNKMYDALVTKAGFTNVSFVGVSSELAVGTIVDITVNGASYVPGSFPKNSSILVKICDNDISTD